MKPFLINGAKVPFERYIVPRVELELVFVLGKPLKGPGVGLLDVLRATEYVVPAIEIIDARVQAPGWPTRWDDSARCSSPGG